MFKCIGCDNEIPWDGVGPFSYTCPCGATIFYNEETGSMGLPVSVIVGIRKGQGLPHLNSIIGESNHTSPLKETLIAALRGVGFIWMEECEQCKSNGTLKKKQEREKHLALEEAERIINEGGRPNG